MPAPVGIAARFSRRDIKGNYPSERGYVKLQMYRAGSKGSRSSGEGGSTGLGKKTSGLAGLEARRHVAFLGSQAGQGHGEERGRSQGTEAGMPRMCSKDNESSPGLS